MAKCLQDNKQNLTEKPVVIFDHKLTLVVIRIYISDNCVLI